MLNLGKPTVDSLKKESENVLSVFRKTVENLKIIKDKALIESENKASQARELSEQARQLETLAEDNNKIAEKIRNLLS